jgi:hypothetical protein
VLKMSQNFVLYSVKLSLLHKSVFSKSYSARISSKLNLTYLNTYINGKYHKKAGKEAVVYFLLLALFIWSNVLCKDLGIQFLLNCLFVCQKPLVKY